LDVGLEVGCRLHHVSQHALRAERVVARPGDLGAVFDIRRIEELVEWLGIGDLLYPLHALVELDAICLHLGDGTTARLPLLRTQNLPGIFDRRLDHADHVKRICFGLRIEKFESGDEEG